jgi:hypothetical protein
MNKLKNLFVGLGGLGLAGVLTFTPVTQAQSRPNDSCHNIDGHISGQLIGPTSLCGGALTEIGTFTDNDGNLLGTFLACATSISQSGNGALEFQLAHTYTTTAGDTFTTTDNILAPPIDPPLYGVNNRVDITGGTGAFQDAFGFIHTHGTVNLYTGVVSVEYHGRMCTPE